MMIVHSVILMTQPCTAPCSPCNREGAVPTHTISSLGALSLSRADLLLGCLGNNPTVYPGLGLKPSLTFLHHKFSSYTGIKKCLFFLIQLSPRVSLPLYGAWNGVHLSLSPPPLVSVSRTDLSTQNHCPSPVLTEGTGIPSAPAQGARTSLPDSSLNIWLSAAIRRDLGLPPSGKGVSGQCQSCSKGACCTSSTQTGASQVNRAWFCRASRSRGTR